MTDQLLFETKDNIATITLNRPDALNAFSEEMIRACRSQLFRVHALLVGYAAFYTRCGFQQSSSLKIRMGFRNGATDSNHAPPTNVGEGDQDSA